MFGSNRCGAQMPGGKTCQKSEGHGGGHSSKPLKIDKQKKGALKW